MFTIFSVSCVRRDFISSSIKNTSTCISDDCKMQTKYLLFSHHQWNWNAAYYRRRPFICSDEKIEKISVQLEPVLVFVRISDEHIFGFHKIIMAKSTMHTSKSQGQMIEMHKTNSHIFTGLCLMRPLKRSYTSRKYIHNFDIFLFLSFFFAFNFLCDNCTRRLRKATRILFNSHAT